MEGNLTSVIEIQNSIAVSYHIKWKKQSVNIYIYLTHDSCAQTDDLSTGCLISQPMLAG